MIFLFIASSFGLIFIPSYLFHDSNLDPLVIFSALCVYNLFFFVYSLLKIYNCAQSLSLKQSTLKPQTFTNIFPALVIAVSLLHKQDPHYNTVQYAFCKWDG